MLNKKKCAKTVAAIGVGTMLLFSNTALAAPLLKPGSRGSEVSQLQQQLKGLGFYTYPKITGYYGTITRDAVSRFQINKGLAADGIAGPKTFAALGKASSGGGSSSKSTLLKRGMRGSAVKDLQQKLKNKGYYKSSVDGIFGSLTEKAVRSFQKSAGIAVDGIAGPVTLARLNGSSSSSRGDSSSSKSTLLKRGMRGSAVKDLQQKLKNKGYYKSSVDGIFGSLTEKAVRNFQKSVGITVDGIAGPVTLAKLNGSSPSSRGNSSSDRESGSSGLASWSKANQYFPLKSKAKVTDVATGKSFWVYRMGGTHHADVEPLTANDTAIMKSIYGGKWSWARRAIIVEINGRKMAASMNGMPHGSQTIHNNNFNGQFCIHFLGSTTHGSGKVDPDHQAMVKKAAKYI
ncbi:MAG: peptidoglycan-binding domain-containing protein [Clostridia bacterium]